MLCVYTILLETIPALFVRNTRAWWKASVICNIVTNPILNTLLFLLMPFLSEPEMIFPIIYLLEVVVIILEAFFYQRLLNKPYKRCLLYSLATNLLSFGIGLIFRDSLFFSFFIQF